MNTHLQRRTRRSGVARLTLSIRPTKNGNPAA